MEIVTMGGLQVINEKKRKNYAISFLVVSIAANNIRCPVGIRLMTKDRLKRKADLVGGILDELFVWLSVKRVLFDRGFCQESIIRLAEERVGMCHRRDQAFQD